MPVDERVLSVARQQSVWLRSVNQLPVGTVGEVHLRATFGDLGLDRWQTPCWPACGARDSGGTLGRAPRGDRDRWEWRVTLTHGRRSVALGRRPRRLRRLRSLGQNMLASTSGVSEEAAATPSRRCTRRVPPRTSRNSGGHNLSSGQSALRPIARRPTGWPKNTSGYTFAPVGRVFIGRTVVVGVDRSDESWVAVAFTGDGFDHTSVFDSIGACWAASRSAPAGFWSGCRSDLSNPASRTAGENSLGQSLVSEARRSARRQYEKRPGTAILDGRSRPQAQDWTRTLRAGVRTERQHRQSRRTPQELPEAAAAIRESQPEDGSAVGRRAAHHPTPAGGTLSGCGFSRLRP